MMKVCFFANPYSPHVRHWLEGVESLDDIDVDIYHIHHNSTDIELKDSINAYNLVPKFLSFLPASIQYFLLGIIFKLTCRKSYRVIHAHNTSGYGLSALLTGKPYGITTYGSEIFLREHKSKVYNKIIKRVLDGAVFITASSPKMSNVLSKELVSKDKIKEFSLGVSPAFYYSLSEGVEWRQRLGISQDDRLIVINRRVAPLYRTKEVIEAFNEIFASSDDPTFHLLVLSGDCDKSYERDVENLANSYKNVHLLGNFLSQRELSGILSSSDFSVSVPRTDQLSSSILESMTCQCIPILADLDSYKTVRDNAILISNDNFELEVRSAFERVKTMPACEIVRRKSELESESKEFDIKKKIRSYHQVLKSL